MNKAIKSLRLIGNLSNKAAYEYTEKDVRQIIQVLQREVEAIRGRFGRTAGAGDSEFSLEP